MLHLGDLKKAGAAAPSASRGRDAQGVADWPARFAGLAEITAEGDGATCREAGTLTLAGGQGFRAERVYLWRPAPGGIEVRFDDGRPFHRIRLGPEAAEAEHLCAADLYRVRYDFAAWPDWRAVWRVTGPAKDYRAETLWQRD